MRLARIVLSFEQYPKYNGKFVAQWTVLPDRLFHLNHL